MKYVSSLCVSQQHPGGDLIKLNRYKMIFYNSEDLQEPFIPQGPGSFGL